MNLIRVCVQYIVWRVHMRVSRAPTQQTLRAAGEEEVSRCPLLLVFIPSNPPCIHTLQYTWRTVQ